MAENPRTWGEAEKIVMRTLEKASKDRARGVMGLSTPRLITDALRKAGLLKEEK